MGRTLKALKRNAEAETSLKIALDLLPQVKKGVMIAFLYATVFMCKLCKAYQPLSFFTGIDHYQPTLCITCLLEMSSIYIRSGFVPDIEIS